MPYSQSRLSVVNAGLPGGAVTGDGPVFLRAEDRTLMAPFGGALHPDDRRAVEDLFSAATHQATGAVLVRWVMPGGELRYFELVLTSGRLGSDPHVHAWDVSAHVRNQQALEHLALHDPLTGLPNRLFFEERVEEELRRRVRTRAKVAVLYADLDGFKQVNDTWGHAAGDILLTTLADRLREAVRPGDSVARLGGDEFALCCPDLSSVDDAVLVANRLIDDVTKPVAIGSALVRVSVAVGVALAEVADPAGGEELIARADLAMYAAKSAGRERVAVAPSYWDRAASLNPRETQARDTG